MQRYWSQIALLLLGVSLTVGFYEGRTLVKNTAKAFTAATSISGSASSRRAGRDGPRNDEIGGDEEDEAGVASIEEERMGGKRGKKALGRTPIVNGDPVDLRPGDKVNMLRQRQRQRLSGRPGGPMGPIVPPPPREEPADAPVDTGGANLLPEPPPAP
jgi:hypothetical protein